MANQIEIRSRIREIAKELESGLSVGLIIETFKVQWGVTERTIKRYVAVAKEMLSHQMDEEDTMVRELRNKVVEEEAESTARSNAEIEAYLVSIIEGELDTRTVITHPGGKTTSIQTKPSRREILKAIDLLWKRRGLYRPAKEKPGQFGNPTIVVETQAQKDVLQEVIDNARSMHRNDNQQTNDESDKK